VSFLSEIQALRIDLYLHQQGLDTTTPSGKAMAPLLLRTVRHMGMPQTETSTARSPLCCAQNISASTASGSWTIGLARESFVKRSADRQRSVIGRLVGVRARIPHARYRWYPARCLVDAHRPCRTDPVAVPEDHDLAGRLLLGSGGRACDRHAPDRCRPPPAGDRGPPSMTSNTFSPKARGSFLA
jgi:hypothetical protein